mgnify:CR=1 FL=1
MSTDTNPTRGYKKKERTRRRLIAAAIDVIAERGEAFTASDIAKHAGVSNGTFYNYFTDRDELIEAVVPEVLSTFVSVSALTVDDTDPALRFATISALALQRAVVAPDEVRVMLRLDVVQQALIGGGAADYLRADLEAGAEAGTFSVDLDDATIDIITGGLLLASRRIVDHECSAEYPTRVIAQLLQTLGMKEPEASSIARQAIAAAQLLSAQPPEI